MNADEAKQKLDRAVFVDVREPFEWDSGHIEGSLHIPMGEISERAGEIPADKEIVVVCQVGQRSELVADWLSSQGRIAYNLEGGLMTWSARGFPLVSEAASEGQVTEGWARDMSGNRLDPEQE